MRNSEDVTAELELALGSLESKLDSMNGMDGVSSWLEEVERVVAAIRQESVATTREEIRTLIDQLMELNAAVQNLARLKQLLS